LAPTARSSSKLAIVTIATYNAAGIRARKDLVLEWLAENEPDVLAIQETKVEDDKFPVDDFEDLGYHLAIHGQKAWNGVAILSRHAITDVRTGMGDALFPEDRRIMSADVQGIRIVNTYVPNGNSVGSEKFEYKLKWLERFAQHMRENYRPSDPLVWLGDVNIAPTRDDVYDSQRMLGGVGHHPEEFKRLDKILEFGLTDVFRMHHKGPGFYTFFDFTIPVAVKRNLGWRIDHIYATENLAARCTACQIDAEARKVEKPSDHTFVVATFDV
jgi:exodeoxyribonuclease III